MYGVPATAGGCLVAVAVGAVVAVETAVLVRVGEGAVVEVAVAVLAVVEVGEADAATVAVAVADAVAVLVAVLVAAVVAVAVLVGAVVAVAVGEAEMEVGVGVKGIVVAVGEELLVVWAAPLLAPVGSEVWAATGMGASGRAVLRTTERQVKDQPILRRSSAPLPITLRTLDQEPMTDSLPMP